MALVIPQGIKSGWSNKTAKQALYEWMKTRKFCRTSDVIRWVVMNHSTRAERNARELKEDGLIKRITDKEEVKKILGYESLESVWVVC